MKKKKELENKVLELKKEKGAQLLKFISKARRAKAKRRLIQKELKQANEKISELEAQLEFERKLK